MKKMINALLWRSAVKKYDVSKKLSKEKIDDLLETIRLSPSAYGILPYKIMVITNAELRIKLRAVGGGQSAMTDASHFLVFAVKTDLGESDIKELISEMSKVRKISPENLKEREEKIKKGLFAMSGAERIEWSTRQAYLALGVLLMAAAAAEIDATPMERLESGKFDEILGLKEKRLKTVVTAALGYRDENDEYPKLAKVRLPKEKVFEWIQ
jgi:nitroreductase